MSLGANAKLMTSPKALTLNIACQAQIPTTGVKKRWTEHCAGECETGNNWYWLTEPILKFRPWTFPIEMSRPLLPHWGFWMMPVKRFPNSWMIFFADKIPRRMIIPGFADAMFLLILRERICSTLIPEIFKTAWLNWKWAQE